MISHFFIDRPIFATVLSVVITLSGGLAVFSLPIAQYPPISPPQVQVAITYPGASAQVVADTVAAPIEQQVNGVPGMLYMSSTSGNNGTYSLAVTFEVGANLNTALVMVQNRVQLAMPLLPTSVQNQGITIRKKTPDILMVISLVSPDERYDGLYLSNFATINLYDPLLRVDGVSDILILGEPNYSIRAWLDPQKLASCSLNASDVARSVASQNVQSASGRIGQPPSNQTQPFDLPIDTQGRLTTPEQFGNIIIKVGNPAQTPRASAKAPVFSASGSSGSGIANPLQASGASSGSLRNTIIGSTSNTSNNPNSTGGGTTSGSTPGSTTRPGMLGGGASTGGGATVSGGGTTAGGASSGGGATTGGAANGGMAGSGINGNLPPTGQGVSALSINTGNASSGGGANQPQPTSTAIVRLRDVARLELAALNYNETCAFDGKPSAGIAIFLLPGINALDVGSRVSDKMKELKKQFPEGIDYVIGYDTTPFIRESVDDVVHTLFEAVVLVGVVVLVFLQNWRAVLIPMIAVPVAIVGTFAVMALVGFSLNNISLFGLVLAIGIVVDDAIVVVENVERWLNEGFSSRDAARKAMDEVTGPVVAVALVLCAVFVPCAFISGITGRFFRQFAVTIAASTVFSALNSLTLSPALAALLLKPRSGEKEEESGAREKSNPSHESDVPRPSSPAPVSRDPLEWALDKSLGWFFRLFNKAFASCTAGYGWIVGIFLRGSIVVLLVYGGLLVLTYVLFMRAPTSFVPQQDQGRLIGAVQLPDSASLDRTRQTIALAEQAALKIPGVAHTLTISGMSFAQQANGSNFGSLFIVLEPFEKRRAPGLGADAIMAKLRKAWQPAIKDGVALVFGAPPIPGLSVAGGFKIIVEDRAGLGVENLQKQTDALIGKLRAQPGLSSVSSPFRSNTPELFLDVDRTKVASMGVSFDDLNNTLGIYLGSLYVNSFNQFGRYWQVTLQADEQYRSRNSEINLLQVRNNKGMMVPLGTLVNAREIGGPIFVLRYNLYPAAPVTGNLLPGISSGQAITQIDDLANQTLPRSMGTEWTELIFLQILEGNTTASVFALAVLGVFLTLSALYESWSLPLAVILVVPLCLLCSLTGVLVAHLSVDVFVQIGLVVLVGLACKNAILIVEFARQLHQTADKTKPMRTSSSLSPLGQATVEASRLRLRPILMTSFAFILGVYPLVVATGAGAEMRRSLGTAVFSGMFGVTVFGIFLTPVFFYVIVGLSEMRLFSALSTRWIGSALMGALLGALAGFLLVLVGAVRQPWGPLFCGCAGTLVVLGAKALRRRRRI